MSIKKTRNPQACHRLAVRITSAKIRAKKEGNRNDTLSVRCHYGYPMKYSKKNELTKRFLYLLLQFYVNATVNTA